uniref:DNA polymerase eta n=1 Tax=Anopheles farauti TaxID=69004 RepID=A0A182QTL6_9DIPT
MSSKTTINIKNKFDRVVVLVDMDCFYCQVEEKLNPSIRGKPIAVVQYNPWQGGGIIAVNYPARAEGVTRHMRGDEAKQHCPEIELPQVPQVRGKADLTRYREAGKEVADVLKSFTPLLERASIDEAYLDITERVLVRIREMNEGKFHLLPEKLANTFAVGYDNIGEFVKKLSSTFETGSSGNSTPDQLEYKKSDIKLLVGASIVNEIRAAVKEKTGYECSAGIAHNKILAKLTAGFHKPNKQTILPIDSISKLYETLPLKKVKGLGGKLGDQVCEVLKIKFMSELVQFPESLLQQHFDERMGSWMYLMARGIDLEAVTAKFHSKSIGCCKRFPGKNAITGLATLTHWLNELATEVNERLEKDLDENNRTAKQLTISYSQQIDNVDVSSSRSIPLVAYDTERIAVDALDAIKRNTERFFKPSSTTTLNNPIKFLGISAGKFEPNASGKGGGIRQMFQNCSTKASNVEGEGPSGIGHPNNGVPARKEATVLPETEQTVTESLPKQEEKNILVTEIRKPKGHIKHFLQNQATLPSTSLRNGTEREDSSKEQSIDMCSIAEKCGEQGSGKAKRDIKHFLKPKSAFPGETAPSTEKKEENNNDKITVVSIEQSTKTEQTYQDAIASHDESEKNATVPDSEIPQADEKPSSSKQAVGSESNANYMQTYAEYCYQLAEPSLVTVDCPQCGKKIPEQEFQSHQDFHFALSLSQQQRDEFRNDLKQKMTAKSAFPAKRPPKAPASTTTATAGTSAPTTNLSIARFLSKVSPEPAVPHVSNPVIEMANKDDTVLENHMKCSECGKMIHMQSITEHNDYHVAKRLQQELNRIEPPSQSNSSKLPVSIIGNSSSAKRKRPAVAGEEVISPAKQKVKPVSSYFTKL